MERVLIVISIVLLIIIISFIGCGESETIIAPGADDFISEGWKEYAAGNYEDAIVKFRKAVDEDPNSSEAYNGIGWAMAKLGRTRDSIDSFKEAVTKDPNNADAHAGLAGAYLADGDYERAIASANISLSLRPEFASHHDNIKAIDVRILLAECYYNIGNYTAAKAQIDLLGGSGRFLDPSSSTYLADLLSLIEELAKKGS